MSTQLMNPQDLVAGLTRASQTLAVTAGGIGTLLRLLKSGFWVYGADDTEVEENSTWAINPASLQHGFVAWKDGELVGEKMVPIVQPPIDVNTLDNVGAQWKAQVSFDLQCMSGEDTDTVVSYKVTSVGGLRASQKIINAILKQITAESSKIVPVVTLETDSYKHKEYGRIYTPELNIQKWLTMDGIEQKVDDAPAALEDQAEEEAAPETKKRKPAAKKKKPEVMEDEDEVEEAEFEEVEEEEEIPAPRRRRTRK